MPSFRERSSEKELLDGDNIPLPLLRKNLRELDRINRCLGGHKVTIAALKPLLNDVSRTYCIADIGCGGGDSLKAIAQWARRRGIKLHLTGIDYNAEAVSFARETCRNFPEITIVQADYREYMTSADRRTDIIISSLFCHHLTDSELKAFVGWMEESSALGFVINDLHRHPLAYYSIWLISRMGGSALLRNDAPLSVLRGFSRDNLREALGPSLSSKARIQWKWAFRYMVTCSK
jgi:SAM-dependent methyltransferase